MRSFWPTLTVLCLLPYAALGVPIVGEPVPRSKVVKDARASLLTTLCDPKFRQARDPPLPAEIFTDPNDPRRRATNGKPDPHEYRYLHYEMRDKVPLLPIGYLHYLVNQYDRQAQTHTNFDEPIPPEGVVLRAPTDLLDLHIIQEGDMNLVWGNVQLAIKEMRKYYEGKATEVEGYWSEVAIQFNYFLEGWARMVERVPAPQECPIKSTAATLDGAS